MAHPCNDWTAGAVVCPEQLAGCRTARVSRGGVAPLAMPNEAQLAAIAGLGPRDMAVWLALPGEARVSVSDMFHAGVVADGRATSLSAQSVRSALEALSDLGLVSRHARGGRLQAYRVTYSRAVLPLDMCS